MRELVLENCRLDKRYDVAGRLGQGSYAEIFVAQDRAAAESSPNKTVVIKALNVFLQDDLDAELERTLVENFQNEAIALDRVRHPNIISRLGHGTARDLSGIIFHYIVLEYMAGGDLHKLSKEKGLSLAAALNYLEQVCAGLAHAHKRGVIHRDIKPQNLLLSADLATVKIADFGVARVHQNDAPITRVGTNIYAPPEHSPLTSYAKREAGSLTAAADIYSLAKSAYTLITGESPRFFANERITELPQAFRGEPWSDQLKEMLARATGDDPLSRPQDIDSFWREIAKLRRYDPTGKSTVTSPLYLPPKPHVAKGYSPIAPNQPRFDTSRDLKLKHPYVPRERVIANDLAENDPSPAINEIVARPESKSAHGAAQISQNSKRRLSAGRRFRSYMSLVLLLSVFAAVIYGTSVMLRGRGFFPQISSAFGEQTGRANTDVNLRPEPNANNDPIGLVTKNARVRIVKTQNNWYQVDVLQQGRDEPVPANRGWLNGRYVDLD